MIQNGQGYYEEIHYEEIAAKFESVGSNGKNETIFRYAKTSMVVLRINE